jgi:hypothetical protein
MKNQNPCNNNQQLVNDDEEMNNNTHLEPPEGSELWIYEGISTQYLKVVNTYGPLPDPEVSESN